MSASSRATELWPVGLTFEEELQARDLFEDARRIADEHKVTVEQLRLNSETVNERIVSQARDHFAYVIVDFYGLSFAAAGRLLHAHHTTIMQCVRRFARACGDLSYPQPKFESRTRETRA